MIPLSKGGEEGYDERILRFQTHQKLQTVGSPHSNLVYSSSDYKFQGERYLGVLCFLETLEALWECQLSCSMWWFSKLSPTVVA